MKKMKATAIALALTSALVLSACGAAPTTQATTTAEETTTKAAETTKVEATTTAKTETVKAGTVKLNMNAKGELTVEDDKKATFKAIYDPKVNAVNFTGSDKKPVSIVLSKGVAIIATDAKKVPTVYVDGKNYPLIDKAGVLSYKDDAGKDIVLKDSLNLKLPSSAEVKATTKATTTATTTKKGEETTKTEEKTNATVTTRATQGNTNAPVVTTKPTTRATQPTTRATEAPTQPTTKATAVPTQQTTKATVAPTQAPTTAATTAPTTVAPTTAAPTEAPTTAPTTAAPTDPAPTELYRTWDLGNSGMEFLYSDHGGEIGAFSAADAWADSVIWDLMDSHGYGAWSVLPLMWSDGEYRSCTVQFRK